MISLANGVDQKSHFLFVICFVIIPKEEFHGYRTRLVICSIIHDHFFAARTRTQVI